MSWKKKEATIPNKVFSGRDYHHLVPRSRCPLCARRPNLLLMRKGRHVELHRVFGNMTLDEIISLLVRLRRVKERQVA